MTIHRSSPSNPERPPARERLRQYWLDFRKLAERRKQEIDITVGKELVEGHSRTLDKMAARREIPPWLADMLKETYEAAVYHIWRSKSRATCYRMEPPLLCQPAAELLVEQARHLEKIAAEGTVDPATLAKVRAALEHDLALYSLKESAAKGKVDKDTLAKVQLTVEHDLPFSGLDELVAEGRIPPDMPAKMRAKLERRIASFVWTPEEIQALYAQLLPDLGNDRPDTDSFEELIGQLIRKPKAAAQFIIDLLEGK